MTTPYKWTVGGLLNNRPDYIPYRWMQLEPDLGLLKTIGSIYNIQVMCRSPYAIDSLRCFYAVHEIVADAPDMVVEEEESALVCGSKRLRGGWDLHRDNKLSKC